MYDVALPVSACLRAGTRVDVAWAVETAGFGSADRAGGLALTPGGGRIGGVLGGRQTPRSRTPQPRAAADW
ncbi:MAG: hypothetical protein R2731_07440 [Nocardioides sp.]